MAGETKTSTVTAENACKVRSREGRNRREDLSMSAPTEFERIVHPREFGFTADELGEGGTDDAAGFCGSRSCSSFVEP